MSFLFTLQFVHAQSSSGSPALGLKAGFFFNTGGMSLFDQSYFSVYLAPNFKIKRYEFFGGIIFPLAVPQYDESDEKAKNKIGATAGYRIYLLNPHNRANVIFQYDFQYISYTKTWDDIYRSYTGGGYTVHYTEKDRCYNSLLGVGFMGYFDAYQIAGISAVVSYIFPVVQYSLSSESRSEEGVYGWGEDKSSSNHLNFCISLTVKIISFRTKKTELTR